MDLKESISNQTDFSLALANRLSLSESKDSNLVFSPLSIHVVLGLIVAGSAGPTRAQLLSILNSKSTDDLNSLSSQLVSLVLADGGPSGGPKLSFANGVWVDQSLSLKASFKQVVDTVYKAVSSHVDFQTKAIGVTNEVNQWAEKETNGLIKEVLPSDSVDHLTRLIFANALYFKGAWIEKFDASETKDQEFHLLNGSSVQVPFMTSKEEQFVSAFNSFKVLRLPYKQGEDKRRFSMYFFLPNAKGGLSALMEKVSSESGFLERHLLCRRVEVGRFRIPKFKFSFGFEASKVLKGLGLVLPFSRGESRLTEMVESTAVGRKLYVSSIFHKACIEVNEEGTEAAAASACVIRMQCLREKIDFVADHPFLFVIREDMTGAVLFIGQAVEETNEVNQWAEKETNGLIKEVLPSGSVDASTRLIFANALYFKGAWIEKFDATETKDQEFHLLNGSSVQVPFMTSKKKRLVRAFKGFKVFGLPYKQGEDKRGFSMYFFLPNAKDGLFALMEKVSSESGFLDRHLPYQRVTVGEFWIPKFKFSFGFEASKVLKGLGLVLPFGGGEGLVEMVDSTSVGRKLYISSIFHKACIEVNEEGTEAAAASAGFLTFECYKEPEEIDFVAGHPFLFVIREDNTGAVLFIGQVLNPLVG
ncbi:hypothetical protein RHGRI_021913 [Rhododendron griersonianum]|uniref:Serpin domain-containing protein n=1 Tax=Rhododendron griersonianum TaxID=479676 RepID=A0AAV6JRA6_9ERIC|nr:hypothetical protein RHGRI_021913 [Rhododendron griersonianum]